MDPRQAHLEHVLSVDSTYPVDRITPMYSTYSVYIYRGVSIGIFRYPSHTLSTLGYLELT